MSHVFAGYHVVFVTKNRQNVIPLSERRTLYNYLYGVLTRFGCTTFRINGMGDHVHLAFDLNPRYALSDVVRDLKRGSSITMGKKGKFPHFEGWARGFLDVVSLRLIRIGLSLTSQIKKNIMRVKH
ncbi:MAG: IS200/IS605 family transposase [Muribaculaceae bacterium]|nr:IS200/IS605 family transposase [Muribaculaceae bacterium]